jgi:gliding motility-associated lipoprotein GldH
MNCIRSLFLLLLSFSIFSCGKNYQYQKEYELEGEKWTYADSLEFAFDIQDTTNIYNLYLKLDHSTSYRFPKPLYLYPYHHSLPVSGWMKSCRLKWPIKPVSGWENVTGTIAVLPFPYRKMLISIKMGRHTILLEQYMRQDSYSRD